MIPAMHPVTIPWPRLPSDSSILSGIQRADAKNGLTAPTPRATPLPTLDLGAINAAMMRMTTRRPAQPWPTFTGSLRCAVPATRPVPSEQAVRDAARSSADGTAGAHLSREMPRGQSRSLMTAVIAMSVVVLFWPLAGAIYLVHQRLTAAPTAAVVAAPPAVLNASTEQPMAPTPAAQHGTPRANVPNASGTPPKQHASLRRPERMQSMTAAAKASAPTQPPPSAATAVATGIRAPQLPPPSAAATPEGESTPRFTRQRRAATEVNEAAASSPLIVP